MAERSRPALASVTIRRLVVPGAEAGPGLGDAIAAALAHELRSRSDPAPQSGMAQAIARGIARHSEIAVTRRGSSGAR
jgi:ribulose kinase